ncbi:conserved hypothetical protein [Histoplasma capsulatum H143]|uniref:Aminoglycoside phosphotransferase domain-containing protein n=1 Tax=Ajellomyces capsulatus (strain H143) TaxID=544712 RepID=C6H3J3_AJECH|nr:conserved hypothetical protein [Histoplasma capsulatum H143]
MFIERRLLRGVTTYSAVVESETNYLLKLTYFDERTKFFALIHESRAEIETTVAYHLGLESSKQCHVEEMAQWIHGTFNVCVPVRIEPSQDRVIIRFTLPYRNGEKVFPGNADEKVRCEAGAYAWLQQECPSIPIPYLHGFGLSNGLHFRSVRNFPWLSRWAQKLRQALLSMWHRQQPSNYIPTHALTLPNSIGSYLVMDYIGESEGQMLSETWDEYREDKKRLTNLFHGLSGLMLQMSRIKLPKIGSFIIDDTGFLRLANRPLTSMLQELENAGVPMHIARDRTFTSVIAYVADLLAYHDNQLRQNANAVKGLGDCVSQICALTIMKAVAPQFYNHDYDAGPFVFSLTDLHQSNIFVDKDWNVTYIIDLEWAASLPVEFIQLPHWLAGKEVDGIELDLYTAYLEEYVGILREGEKKVDEAESHPFKLSHTIDSGWKVGTFWFNLALRSPPAMHSLFYNRIQPQFASQHLKDQEFYKVVAFYWCREASAFIRTKCNDKKNYDIRLKEAFQSND